MTSEALVAPLSELPVGEARFIRPSEAKSILLASERDEYVTVDIPEIRTGIRGRLAWLLEEAIERSLELRGACGPGIGASASLENSLADQLYRARLLGARGFTIALPTLEGITNRSGALDSDDSATLHWWIGSTRKRPLRLYLDVADCMLGAYLEPVTLTHLMNNALPPLSDAAPPVVVEWVDSAAASTQESASADVIRLLPNPIEASPISDVVASTLGSLLEPLAEASPVTTSDVVDELQSTEATEDVANQDPSDSFESLKPPATSEIDDTTASRETSEDLGAVGSHQSFEDVEAPRSVESLAADAENDDSLPTEVTHAPLSLAPTVAPPPPSRSLDVAPSVTSDEGEDATAVGTIDAPEPSDIALTPLAAPVSDEALRSVTEVPSHESAALPEIPRIGPKLEVILPEPHPPTLHAPAAPFAEQEPELAPEEPSNLPLHVDAPNAWRSWMQRLDAARGPKPLNAIEQLFINAYVPLMDAYQRGIAGIECKSVLDHWASSFSKSYTEAFDALRLRGRRPMMVLDIPEAAQRLARLHGARSVQLVLVDGMRFDLGLRVESRLVAKLGQQATLTDRFLLWSALPTTTAQQLELIARGPEGLRDGDVHSETPVVVARGRSASTLRRVRAGNRELLKLDLAEARLGEPGGPLSARLDQLGVEVGDTLAVALGRMPPRTLVAVFGDHGFCLGAQDQGTTALRAGGASPEEVLVPGYAWLVGPTH